MDTTIDLVRVIEWTIIIIIIFIKNPKMIYISTAQIIKFKTGKDLTKYILSIFKQLLLELSKPFTFSRMLRVFGQILQIFIVDWAVF